MNPFNNPQIDIDGLPEAEELSYQGLEPSYRSVLLISNTILFLIIGIGLGTAFYNIDEDIPRFFKIAIPIVYSTLLILSFLSIIFGFKNKLFAIREMDLNYKKGWLWKSRMVVPFKRIQHSEVTQGPIDRLFDLAKLKVYTAGGSGSDLTIPGLKQFEADKLKMLITSRITKKAVANGREEE